MEGLVTLQLYRFVAEERNYRPLRLCNKILSARSIFFGRTLVYSSASAHAPCHTLDLCEGRVDQVVSDYEKRERESGVIELVSRNFCGR